MPVIVVANPKGGVGKTTLATNLAGYFASQGHAVMLGDIDRQQSSRAWLSMHRERLMQIGAVLLVVIVTKFLAGAWIAILAMSLLFVLMKAIHKRLASHHPRRAQAAVCYQRVTREWRAPSHRPSHG